MRIILAGPKGSGKSTIGRELGKRLAREVIETDELAERIFQRLYHKPATCREICLHYGEERFREIEKQAVFEALQLDECIICTGGQTVVPADSRQALVEAGNIVVLQASFDLIWKRILRQGFPPYFPEHDQKSWFQQRVEMVYNLITPDAKVLIEVDKLSPKQAAEQIGKRLAHVGRRP